MKPIIKQDRNFRLSALTVGSPRPYLHQSPVIAQELEEVIVTATRLVRHLLRMCHTISRLMVGISSRERQLLDLGDFVKNVPGAKS